MKIYQIDPKRWQAGLETLKKAYRLFGPVKDQEFFLFKPLNESEAPNLAFQNTRLSALSLIHISEPTRPELVSRMTSSA